MPGNERFEAILARLSGVVHHGDWTQAQCPAHNDDRSSLSLSIGDDGRVLVKCFAGCKFADIVQTIGLPMSFYFPESDGPKKPKKKGVIECTYPYTDENGSLLFEVVRYKPKDFKHRRPDGAGGWVWSMKNVRRVLYRLPEVISAVRQCEPVYFVEGEKDANNLVSLGVCGTSASGGAKAPWQQDYTEALQGADVVIMPDNDEPGRKFARAIIDAISNVARSIKVCDVAKADAECKDVSDFLAAHGPEKTRTLLARAVSVDEWILNGSGRETDASEDAIPARYRGWIDGLKSGECLIELPDGRAGIIIEGPYGVEDTWLYSAAWRALRRSSTRYVSFGGKLAYVLPTGTVLIPKEHAVRARLAPIADWIKLVFSKPKDDETPKKVAIVHKPVPGRLAAAMREEPSSDLPDVERVSRAPFFFDGELVQANGYHAPSKTWLENNINGIDLTAPVSLLTDDLWVDFPFNEASLANAIGLLLSPLVIAFDGTFSPWWVITAPTPQSGKGLAASVIFLVHTGEEGKGGTLPKDDAEVEKKITAKLKKGSQFVFFDNLPAGLISSASLCSGLTMRIWAGRNLGQSEELDLINRATWLATGNNPVLSDELSERKIEIRLSPQMERPGRRTGFKHPYLVKWVQAHRGKLYGALLGMIQRWYDQGAPLTDKTMGQFTPTVQTIGGILETNGIGGFLDDRADGIDPETEAWRSLVSGWLRATDGMGRHIAGAERLCRLAAEMDLFGVGDGDRSSVTRMGQLLTAKNGAFYEAEDGRLYEIRRLGLNRSTRRSEYEVVPVSFPEPTPLEVPVQKVEENRELTTFSGTSEPLPNSEGVLKKTILSCTHAHHVKRPGSAPEVPEVPEKDASRRNNNGIQTGTYSHGGSGFAGGNDDLSDLISD